MGVGSQPTIQEELMTWVRLDEGFPRHPKVAASGPLGMAMQVSALCYCNEYLTDGFVPKHVVAGFLNLEGIAMNMWQGDMIGGGDDATWQLIVNDLIESGLWYETAGGYRIHDFLKYQPSKADVEADRKQKREAGRLGGINSAIARRAKTSHSEAGAEASATAVAQALPQAESKPVSVPVSVTTNPSFLQTSTRDAEGQEGLNIGNLLKEVDAA
jgi:hypothetical protein